MTNLIAIAIASAAAGFSLAFAITGQDPVMNYAIAAVDVSMAALNIWVVFDVLSIR